MTQESNNIVTNNNNRLSVQVTLTGLSFLVIYDDEETNDFFKEIKFDSSYSPGEILIELEKAFSNHEELSGSFNKVSIVYSNSVYTLVPKTLFEEKKLSDYLKFNSKLLSNDFIAFDQIENHGVVIVYVPYININNYIFDRFGTFEYFHSSSVLLKEILNIDKHSKRIKAYIHVADKQFEFVVLKQGQLEFCNTFIYNSPEDFIYYILFSVEQLNLDPETIDIILIGSIQKSDASYQLLYKYLRNIAFFQSESTHSNFILKNTV